MASPRARYRSVPRKETKGRARSRTTADSPLPCPIQNHSSVKGIPEASRQDVREAKLGRVRRVSGAKKHVIGGGGVGSTTCGWDHVLRLLNHQQPSDVSSLPPPPPATADATRHHIVAIIPWKKPSPVPHPSLQSTSPAAGRRRCRSDPPHPKSRWTVLSRVRGRPAVGQLTEQPIDSALLHSDRCSRGRGSRCHGAVIGSCGRRGRTR